MNKLVIIVQKKWCHPYFGGERIEEMEFDNLQLASIQFYEWKKQDCEYQQTAIYISEIISKEEKP